MLHFAHNCYAFYADLYSVFHCSAHPHTVSLMGLVYDEAAGTLGLVCELMAQDLAGWLRESRPVVRRARVLRSAADGLAYIHSNGLVHRDIKSANIFVSGGNDPTAKIGDFGFTSVVGGWEGWTKAYAAPEVLGRDDVSTAASDAYSFGLVVYEVMTEVEAMPTAREREGNEGAPPWTVKGGHPEPEGWWAMVLTRVLSLHPDERLPVSDWDEVLGAIEETKAVNCSRFLGLCMAKRWEVAMACTEGIDTEGVNERNDGRNALHFLFEFESAPLALVAKCVELGCDINAFSTNDWLKGPPLAFAQAEEIAAELVAHGADVNAADEDMVTVLMCAASNGRTFAVRFLLDTGADPLAVDRVGRTAIDWAYEEYYFPSEDVALFLLEAGAVPGYREYVMEKARVEGHNRVVAWLETAADGENSSSDANP